jgi:hypothetical protein
MKKTFKIIGIVVVVLLGVLITLPWLFKDKITDIVKEEAGKSLEAKIDFGDFGVSLIRNFPNFSLSLEDLTISGKGKFENDTLLKVEKIALTLDLMSVIKGEQYSVKRIAIDKPQVHLKVLTDSSANWNITKADTATKQESDPASSFKVALNEFSINGATIVFDDKSAKTYAEIIDLNFKLHGDLTSEKTTLNISTSIASLFADYGGVRYLNNANATFEAGIEADMINNLFTFTNNRLTVNQLAVEFEGWLKMLPDAFAMDMKFKAPDTEFKSVLSMVPAIYAKQFADIKTSGKFSLTGFAKGEYRENHLPEFGIDFEVSGGTFQYPALPAPVNNIAIKTTVVNPGGSADNTVVDISRFHLDIVGNPIDLGLKISTPVSDPDLTARASGRLDLSSIEKIYPIEQKLNGIITADMGLSGKMSALSEKNYNAFKAHGTLQVEKLATAVSQLNNDFKINNLIFKFAPEFLELSQMDASLGKSDFKAQGKITSYLEYLFKNGILEGNLNLQSDYLLVDELMPASSEAADTATTASQPPVLPERIHFTASAVLKKVVYDKMQIDNLQGKLTLNNQRLTLENLNMAAFGGTLKTNGYFSTPTNNPMEMKLDADMQNISLQALANAVSTVDSLAPVLKKIEGLTSMTMSFKTNLKGDMTPELKSITSSGNLKTSQLKASGIEVLNKASELLKMENLKTLKINPTNLSYLVQDGKLLVKPFDLKVDQFTGTLAGTTDLETQGLDYVLNLQIPRSTFGTAANSVVDGLVAEINKKGIAYEPGKNVAVDLLIGGHAKKPNVTMKLGKSSGGGSVASDLKAKAEEEFNKKKQEVEAQAKAEIEKQKAAAEARLKQEQEKLKQEAEKKKKELELKAKKEADSLKKKLEQEAKKKLKKFF